MNDNEMKEIIKETLKLIKEDNYRKKDFIKSIVNICIALIISFTVIICCFYILYFTMWGGEKYVGMVTKNSFSKRKEK